MSDLRRICLLGFGEVGQVLAADLRARGEVVAWDPLFSTPSSSPSRAAAAGLARAARGATEAVTGADLVVSAVTAAQCVAAAADAAPALATGTVYLDLNSVSPATRARAASTIEGGGGRYVEAAVMSPIGPKRIGSPMLLGGPHAETLLPTLQAIGFGGATAFSPVIGRASAAKMCRSVMIKGMEALLGEALLAARHHEVEQVVLESLRDLFPGLDWRTLARYMIGRSLQHGRRRAEEMREVALTVDEAGVGSAMSRAATDRQDWAALHSAALRTPDARADAGCDPRAARSRRGPLMIIDCHGHYTTAPAGHSQFRERQLAWFANPALPAPTPAVIGDDEIRETIETNQLALQRKRGSDLTLFSPRASAMGHHEGDEAVSLVLDARLQRPDRARRRALSRQLRGRLPASAVTGRAARGVDRGARALRARPGLRRLQPEPRSVGRPLDRAAAHRSALVPALREDGRARRAGDGPRVCILQSELPRDRCPLHQRGHDRVHAVHPGRPVPRLSRRFGS